MDAKVPALIISCCSIPETENCKHLLVSLENQDRSLQVINSWTRQTLCENGKFKMDTMSPVSLSQRTTLKTQLVYVCTVYFVISYTFHCTAAFIKLSKQTYQK